MVAQPGVGVQVKACLRSSSNSSDSEYRRYGPSDARSNTQATAHCVRDSSSTCYRHHSRDEVRTQLDTAIDWGRYAELFEYDGGHGEVSLHVHPEQP